MSNEEKILSILTKMQGDIVDIKKRLNILEGGIQSDESIAKQLETLDKMRHLLTKEEADELAAAIGG